MKKLKLPVIKTSGKKQKILSMDEYVEFVMFNLKHVVDKKATHQWKKMLAVDVPFIMK